MNVEMSKLPIVCRVVSQNYMTGAIPAAYSSMQRLQLMYLWNNLLTGTVPSQYSSLPSLEYL